MNFSLAVFEEKQQAVWTPNNKNKNCIILAAKLCFTFFIGTVHTVHFTEYERVSMYLILYCVNVYLCNNDNHICVLFVLQQTVVVV